MPFGLTLSSEEHPPERLVAIAELAEANGFDFVSLSDHLHPWVDAQGHSPFVWSVAGAVIARTERIGVGIGVTCPLFRFPPLLAAHASATTARLAGDRFRFGVGSGEALNEHVGGAAWPAVDVRHEMLVEATELIRRLWSGELVTHRGRHFTVEQARLYDLPDRLPPLIVSAFGPRAAELAAQHGDGLWTNPPGGEVVDAWRQAGGTGPVYGQLTVCWHESEAEARRIAHRQWSNTGVPGQLSQDLPTPAHFEMASSNVTEEQVASSVACGPDPEPILELVHEAVEAGIDHLYFHQVGDDQEGFVQFFTESLRPALQGLTTR